VIAQPSTEMQADAKRARRVNDPIDFRVHRYIEAKGDIDRVIWLSVGDSVALRLAESHCEYDYCSSGRGGLRDSTWEVDDRRIARLQHVDPHASRKGIDFFGGSPHFYLKALRPGRTVVRVRGVSGLLDAAAEWEGATGVVERVVAVTPPIARVEIFSRPDTVRRRESFLVRARAFARGGEVVEGLPFVFEPLDGSNVRLGEDVPILLNSRGPTRIVARLREFADTTTVFVVDSAEYRVVR
jgi:hypothetical protein